MIIPVNRLKEIEQEYSELKVLVNDVSLMRDQRKYRETSRKFNELSQILETVEELKELSQRLQDNLELEKKEKDHDFLELIKSERDELNEEIEKTEEHLKELLIPTDPNDNKNAIVEIRAGTGGDEAALFAADLFRMYSHYAEKMKWKLTVLDANQTGLGGYKEVVFSLEGDEVYGNIRFESGVHRVQRVPDTEASGRIHTSAITVAVLPEAEEIDIEIDDNDLKIDVYRSSGSGGQHVNTTDSAVRITHFPSGLVVTCQDEKSQIKNRAKALKVLRSKLLDLEISKKEQEISSTRKAQVGTGDRSDKIRTYNFPQNRVTDHRINLTSHRLEAILDGDIEEFIENLKIAYRKER
ncbi:MAG: peptide chain release factor 1, partial [Candidatus Cloacimonas sp.]